jgi:adenylate cyclase class IV
MYEIEIKSLLGSVEEADRLRQKLSEVDESTKLLGTNKQLNHYFIGGDMGALHIHLSPLFLQDAQEKLKAITEAGVDFSVRTREVNGKVLLVVKASIDDTTSANGIARIEFEEEVSALTLEELDQKLLSIGFEYQAKWSREREEYTCKNVNVTVDKNAGYGYLAEFEKVVDDAKHAESVQHELRTLMEELEVVELAQDRLERMFAHYNENWPKYYGTDNIFVIE